MLSLELPCVWSKHASAVSVSLEPDAPNDLPVGTKATVVIAGYYPKRAERMCVTALELLSFTSIIAEVIIMWGNREEEWTAAGASCQNHTVPLTGEHGTDRLRFVVTDRDSMNNHYAVVGSWDLPTDAVFLLDDDVLTSRRALHCLLRAWVADRGASLVGPKGSGRFHAGSTARGAGDTNARCSFVPQLVLLSHSYLRAYASDRYAALRALIDQPHAAVCDDVALSAVCPNLRQSF